MHQIEELNERIPAHRGDRELTADSLGLADTTIHPEALDRVAATMAQMATGPHRQPLIGGTVPPPAALAQVVAAGAPSFPYIYGLFAAGNSAGPQLPVMLHTRQLQAISSALHLRHHRWGV
jgi:hypothetical protein